MLVYLVYFIYFCTRVVKNVLGEKSTELEKFVTLR